MATKNTFFLHPEHFGEMEYRLYKKTVKLEVLKDIINGRKYVDYRVSRTDVLHMQEGNNKLGHILCFNFAVAQTCNHSCECCKGYDAETTTKKGKKKVKHILPCYALNGSFLMISNQRLYSENLAFYRENGIDTTVNAIAEIIRRYPDCDKVRFFSCGDFPDAGFVEVVHKLALMFPNVSFYAYTKKYALVNTYVRRVGIESIPENMVVIFSHWRNNDGTYFPMVNPFDFPTSEFVPHGMEYILEKLNPGDHICPCSDETKLEHCDNCSTPCYKMKRGQKMYLLEHSTMFTKARDMAVKLAHAALAAAMK